MPLSSIGNRFSTKPGTVVFSVVCQFLQIFNKCDKLKGHVETFSLLFCFGYH